MAMTDREYQKWVREIVVAPLRRHWGVAWKMALNPEIRSALVAAQCFSVVRHWAASKDERGMGVTEAEMEKLLAAARAEFGDELEK